MDPIARKTALQASVVKGGQSNAARVGGTGGAPKEVRKQEAAATRPGTPQAASTTDDLGVTHTERLDGSVSMQAKSGMGLEISQQGDRTVSMEGNSFRLQDGKVEVLAGSAKEISVSNDNKEGSDIISFKDQAGDLVQVEPDSMTYSVTRKAHSTAGVTQVFYPNGDQEVTAFGYGDGKPYEKTALLDEKGTILAHQGFGGLDLGAQEIRFEAGGNQVKRSLARPLPGQQAVAPQPQETSKPAPAVQNAAPTSLLAEGPSLLALPAGVTPGILGQTSSPTSPLLSEPMTGTQETPPTESKANDSPFPQLPGYQPGFFDMNNGSDSVGMSKTASGVVVREEGATRSFQLPNGDMFRTDGEHVEVLGDSPRARSARVVLEDGQQLLAYRDKERNAYQLNVNTGDLSVSNHNGTLKQSLKADGTQEFEARSTHTTQAGSKEHSFHTARFGADGTLVEKTGFDNLEVGEKSLTFSLPNGEETVRNLIDPTSVRYREPKPDAPGVQEGWGDTQAALDSILGMATPKATASTPAPETSQTEGPSDPDFGLPEFAKNGMSRTTLPDGSVLTRLPSGVSINDNGEQPFATDVDGTRLEVLKREVPTDSGYILYTKSKDGVGYTIAPDHLDMLVESKDGKVHQMATEDGFIDTRITDGKFIHAHQLNTNTMQQVASPGVHVDIRTPNRLFIDGPDNRSYELPHALPTGPGGPQPYGQGGPQPYGQGGPMPHQTGVKPSFWERIKGAFTGENPWDNQAHHGAPPYVGGMPSSHYQYDPMQAQYQQMQRTTNMMNTMSMVTMGVSALSLMAMPTMFYPSFGYGFF
ncbi:MAG: hypothetical protein WC314_23605 [Vulcanimicrobiota bacterium]